MADLAHQIPITPETRFNIGSASKQFLGFAFALLAEQGALSLEDPVREHLPDWPKFSETVTLRHLLTHTSGYREAYGTLYLAGRVPGQDYLPREEALDVVRRQPKLEFSPGSTFQYNSTAFVILADVLEQVTGEAPAKWMEENVFRPLGMKQTSIEREVGQVIPKAADSYTDAEHGGYIQEASNRSIFWGRRGLYDGRRPGEMGSQLRGRGDWGAGRAGALPDTIRAHLRRYDKLRARSFQR